MPETQSFEANGSEGGSLRLLGALGAAAGLAFIFVKLWSEVAEGETHALDSAILLALRIPGHPDMPIGPPWLPDVMINFSSLGSGAVLGALVIAAIGYLIVKRIYVTALVLAAATISGALAVMVLKDLFGRPRPELIDHLVQAQSMSFPSGHAANSALVYLTIATLVAVVEPERRARLFIVCVAIALTIIVGASRLYLGIHWPSDVAAGWSLGAGWAILWQIIASRLHADRRAGLRRPPDTTTN